FKAVLRGTLPHTNERIRWDNPNPDTKERLAHDVVLSAPKSISMALHLEDDLRIFDAHTAAVQATLDLIEQEVAQTRIQVNGVRSVVFTGNLIAALIPHHTSRDGDMQLHTHMLIMNGTQGPDGVWRSLSHESLASAEWVGSYYRQKLAENVQALGYRIETTQDGFELAGYDRDEMEVFSKRNRAIVQSVMDQGLEINPQTKKAAVLPTRKAKSKVGQKLEIIQEQWQQEAQQAGIGHPIQVEPIPVQSSLSKGQFEVDSAIRHLSETAVSFSRSEIYAYAFKHVHSKGLEIDHLNAALADRNDLIAVGKGRMTTVDALEREIATIQTWTLGQGKAKPILDPETARNVLSGTSLNTGQFEAVLNVACATDQHLIIQGLAGVGKTHALGALKHLIEASDQAISIQGFSPTLKAAQQLQQEMGITTHTVESLVRREADLTPNQLWIIDEAGMVSAEQMLTLVEKANTVGARILLVGDTGQNPSVKAGSPMKSLMQNGATTFKLSDIIRQQNSMQKRAVELIANGQPVEALSILSENGHVQAMPSQPERVQAIAQDYLSLNRTERSKTLIVTGTNTERNAITQAIRAGLKTEGSLGAETTILRISSQYLSVEEKRRVENFETGSYIQLLRNYQSTPLQQNQLYQVMGREGDELVVSSPGGRLYRFDPSLYAEKEVFKAEPFAVAVGDQLRWTASNRKEGQINGSEFTVIGVTDKTLIVADDKGTKIVTLNQP
ncbi:MAG: MobF family relaxase, partial [Thermosynechococcaceae cyanobacterium]